MALASDAVDELRSVMVVLKHPWLNKDLRSGLVYHLERSW